MVAAAAVSDCGLVPTEQLVDQHADGGYAWCCASTFTALAVPLP